MRLRFISLCLLILGVLFCTTSATAQLDPELSPYVYFVTIGGCKYKQLDDDIRYQTGFLVRGQKFGGIVTALHGVADCLDYDDSFTITADNEYNTGGPFRDLELRMVDIDRDIALLSSDDLDDLVEEGFEVLSPDVLPTLEDDDLRRLKLIGHPQGNPYQQPKSVTSAFRTELYKIIPDKERGPDAPLVTRNSPNLDFEVYQIEAHLQPGHSGAPILTQDDKLFAIANGGLDGGSGEVAWAIPWHDIELRPVEEVQARLEVLENTDPRPALSHLSTWSDVESGAVPSVQVSGQYTAYFTTGKVSLNHWQGSELVQTEVYFDTQRDGAGNTAIEFFGDLLDSGNLLGVDTLDGMEVSKMGYYSVDGTDYVFAQIALDAGTGSEFTKDMCLYFPEPVPIADSFFQMLLRIAQITVSADDPLIGTLVDEGELINGKPTRHYLLSPLSQGSGNEFTPIGGHIWLGQPENTLVRADVDYENFRFLGNDVADTASFLITFSELESSAIVDLPPNCLSNLIPWQGPLPEIPVMAQEQAPSSDSVQISATHGPVSIRHNLSRRIDGVMHKVMSISFDLTVENGLGRPVFAAVHFLLVDGTPLAAATPAYSAGDGTLSVGLQFEAESSPDSDRITLFLPYDQLILPPGAASRDLRYQIRVYDMESEDVLAESKRTILRYRLPDTP